MATANRTSEQGITKTLGVLLNALNPFKKIKPTHSPKKSANAQKQRKHGKRKSSHAHARSAQPSAAKSQEETFSENFNAESHPMMAGLNQDANPDPAHAPGHRKLKVKESFIEPTGDKVHIQESALNRNANGDIAARVNSPSRRINSPSRNTSKRGSPSSKKSH